MRRSLTGPSPDRLPPARSRPGRGRSGAAGRRGRGRRPARHGGDSAGDGRPSHAHVRWPGRGGAGRPGDRVLPAAGGRAPPCRARSRIPPGPRSRAPAGTRCAHQRRTRAAPDPAARHLAGAPGWRVMTRRWCPARGGMPSARLSPAIGPRLTAFTTLEASAFCPPAGSKYGRSCAGMDGWSRSWPLRRYCLPAPLPR
jgi:hypothetical protein